MPSRKLSDNLKRRAIYWAGQLTRLAKQFAPAHIKSHIRSFVETSESAGNKYSVIIEVPVSESLGTADAKAQEFGSGLHSQKGPREKYPILPKNRRALAFNWEVANRNPDKFNFTDDGRVILPKVMHPGIVAANSGKGYIRPAVAELRTKAVAQLDSDVREAILGEIFASFKHAKR